MNNEISDNDIQIATNEIRSTLSYNGIQYYTPLSYGYDENKYVKQTLINILTKSKESIKNKINEEIKEIIDKHRDEKESKMIEEIVKYINKVSMKTNINVYLKKLVIKEIIDTHLNYLNNPRNFDERESRKLYKLVDHITDIQNYLKKDLNNYN